MITTEHMRQRVVGVAADLVSTLGLVAPLMRLEDFGQLGRDKEHAGRFLRKLLTRNVVLFITRLHEPAGSGRTEETASIDGLLEYSSGQLSDETIAELKTPRMELIADLEASGVKYKDLYAFRAALIAHSIHREMTAADNTIFYSTIADFALKTYALVLAIERELIITGSTQFMDMPDLVDVWETRGTNFWKDLPRRDGESATFSAAPRVGG